MKLCCDCGTPLTAEEITYYETSCDTCEGRRMSRFDDDFNENPRDALEVDSRFDGLMETVIVQVKGPHRTGL